MEAAASRNSRCSLLAVSCRSFFAAAFCGTLLQRASTAEDRAAHVHRVGLGEVIQLFEALSPPSSSRRPLPLAALAAPCAALSCSSFLQVPSAAAFCRGLLQLRT